MSKWRVDHVCVFMVVLCDDIERGIARIQKPKSLAQCLQHVSMSPTSLNVSPSRLGLLSKRRFDSCQTLTSLQRNS